MSDSGVNQGIGVPGILLIVFIILKLCDVIDWSWWWVLSPLWISFALMLIIGIPILIWISKNERKPKWGKLPYE